MLTSPDRIGVVGDVHGNVTFALKAVRALQARGCTAVHFLGDFGVVWTGLPAQEHALDMLETVLAEFEMTGLVTGGNHDGYTEWYAIEPDEDGLRWIRPHIALLPRGWRAQTESGHVVASLGGANSIDRPYRERLGYDWWPEEQITEDDLAALGTDPVDVLLGHDAPMSKALTHKLIPNEHYWEPAGLTYAKYGQAVFHRGFQQVHAPLTISGHYHVFVDTTEEYEDLDGAPFTSRSVVLEIEGKYPSVATVDVPTGVVEFVNLKPTPPRGWTSYTVTPGK